MRILLVNHFPLQGSGSGIYTLNIALELVAAGHSVFVLDIDNTIDKTVYPFRYDTIICDETKNENPDLSFNFPCFTTHPRSKTTFYELNDKQIAAYVDTFISKIKKTARNFLPDVVHTQHLWVTPYAANKVGIPYVITVHGTDLMGFRKDRRYHQFARAGAAGAAKIITISRQVHNDTISLFDLDEEKLFLNPNGFDDDIFRVKKPERKVFLEKLGIYDESVRVIGFVGKFTEFKGIDILLKAAVKVSERIRNAVFILAGNGESMKEMQVLQEKLNLKNVIFWGHRDQNEVADLYNIAELAVIPSRKEPFGLVAIEALACGTPVVATRAGGLPDFINDKVGQLVEMDNVEKLADAVIDELINKTKVSKGKFAAKYALQNYSWKKTIRKVIEIYSEAKKTPSGKIS